MDPDRKPTIWQYARRKFHCTCECVLMTSMPIVRGNAVQYMALCPECNERKYVLASIDQVDMDRLYREAGD